MLSVYKKLCPIICDMYERICRKAGRRVGLMRPVFTKVDWFSENTTPAFDIPSGSSTALYMLRDLLGAR